MITCFIRYEIDPFKERGICRVRPQLGAGDPAQRRRPHRLFRPARGFGTTAYGVYNIESLASYEAYRARLAADPLGRRTTNLPGANASS
jgi:hypothetical protein